MFTGIIEEIGRVRRVTPMGGGVRLEIEARQTIEGAREGDSISTDGVCLTAVHLSDGAWEADCSAETLRLTTIGGLRAGDRVNLERALALGDRLGGHLVQGHVEGTGTLVGRRPEGTSHVLRFEYPQELGRYLVHKGSIAVSGISLTVAALDRRWFEVAAIPVTLERTTLGTMEIGTRVNLETDMIAKYVESLLAAGLADARTSRPTNSLC